MQATTVLTTAFQEHLLTKVPQPIRHAGYVGVAKSRAKILGLTSRLIPMPRPLMLTGADASLKLCELIVNAGHQPLLIVSDKVLVKLGLLTKMTDYFDRHQLSYSIYDEVTPDPTFAVVKQGLTICHQHNYQGVLAVGGGSVIDTAKMIAMSASNHCQPEALIGLFKGRNPCMPLYAIPTTAGTGSEATIGAVLSDDTSHQKSIAINPKMVPMATAIDAEIMKGLPAHITAETGIDALTHALEAWMSTTASAETDYYAASAVKAVLEHLLVAYQDGNNLQAREALGIAAHYGGIALNKAGLGYVHAIAHRLGAYYHIAHGRANAIVLPYILRFNTEVSAPRLAMLAKKIGATKDAHASDELIAQQFIQQINTLLTALNIDRQVANMDEKHFMAITKAVAKEVSDTYAVPKYMTATEVKQILMDIKQTSINSAKITMAEGG